MQTPPRCNDKFSKVGSSLSALKAVSRSLLLFALVATPVALWAHNSGGPDDTRVAPANINGATGLAMIGAGAAAGYAAIRRLRGRRSQSSRTFDADLRDDGDDNDDFLA